MLFLAMSILMIGCSTDDGGETPEPKPTPTEDMLVANNDQVTGKEDEDLVISGILDNDVLVNGAKITDVSGTSANGLTITDNRNGTFTYVPADNFTGEDSFTYTICDTASPQNCDTATVTITIEDAGTPEASDDTARTVESISIELNSLLENDVVVDDATITIVDETSTKGGTVEINEAGNVVYTPASGFTGEDSFTYSICDDDETASCDTATVTVSVYAPVAFDIPADLQDYYQSVAFSSEVADLNYELLADLTEDMHTTKLIYTDRHDYLYDADADLVHPDSVVLVYSGERRYWKEYAGNYDYSPQTFNTEHIYPQSLLASEEAKNDLHLLRVADEDVNSLRLNYPYGDGSGEYGLVGDEVFYPGDEWKGDIARIIMYVNLRYGEGFSTVGGIDLFLKWNREDPVSAFELQRQEVIEAAQGDRNPFIDNPYLATLIWGGDAAENRWE